MENKILKTEYIFLDQEINTQKEAFDFISQKALELKLVNNKEALINGYKNRELEGSTGFEDGFAIPHARIKEVNKAAVIVVRFKNDVNWNSLDGKPTKVAIALLIPDGPSGEEHLSILSDIAMKLMNEDFKKTLLSSSNKNEILEALTKTKEIKKEVEQKPTEGKLNILAITACITGVAHTYMAEDKLLKMGKEMGYNIRVETHGSKGVGTPFTKAEIDAADIVIFATDTNIDNSRFAGKKFYKTKVAPAIKDPKGIINKAISEGYTLETNVNLTIKNSTQEKQGPLQHILAGISYMIPVIILGGICLAFSLGIAKAIWGASAGTDGPNGEYPWGPLNVISIIGAAAFSLMIPILGGFIANSIAGRSAIAPAMVASFIGNQAGALTSDGKDVSSLGDLMPWIKGMDVVQTPMGFIGAIIAGLCIGYAVKWINTWNVPKSLRPAMPIFFVPLFTGILMSLIFVYVIGAPIGWVMEKIQNAIKSAYGSGNAGIGIGIGLGLILGAMGGFDMGGPVNKIAFVTCSILVTSGIQEPMGSLAAGIPVAPLSMGLSTIICKKFFTKEEQGMGIAAMIMGCIGISEGAIPFAIRDPKRAIICNVAGSAVASAIAGGFQVQDAAAHGGPIVAILGAVPYGVQTLYFFIAIAIGVLVTTSMYCAWMIKDAGAPGSVKEAHVAYLETISNEYSEKIEVIKEERKATKDTNQKATLKKQIAKLKEEHKTTKERANKVLKEISKSESEFIKTKKEQIKNFKSENKNNLNVELKNKNKEINSIKDKEAKENFKEEISTIKENSIKNYENFQGELRNDFVEQYNKAIA